MRQLKAAANGLTDEASQLRYRLSQARGQGELLRSQIVQSPQKVQALLAEISAAVERERGCVADAGGHLQAAASAAGHEARVVQVPAVLGRGCGDKPLLCGPASLAGV